MKSELLTQLEGKKVAFISVFDKTGLESLARQLTETYSYTILSTGGTKKFLDERQIPAIESSEVTGFEELLGGRVKSLHPAIFAGILAESQDRGTTALKEQVPFLIDLVVVNLYPFEAEREHMRQGGEDVQDPMHLLHFIDIGGSALIRAAAKNYPAVNILSQPGQYEAFCQALAIGQGETTIGYRKKLAFSAFAQSSYYDGLIQQTLMDELPKAEVEPLPDAFTLPLSKITNLRYGENPHQQAALYGVAKRHTDFECLHGKTLSFNNILDMQAAWNIVTEFSENPACAIVKHNNPCGVAISTRSLNDAFARALDTDPLSAFGGVVAFNQPVTLATAKHMKEIFLEVIIAPDFEEDAFEWLSSKKNLRLVKRELPEPAERQTDYKQVSEDLFLVQTTDPLKMGESNQAFKVATEKKPSDAEIEDMVFAWKVVKHVKSNAIVLAKDGKTVGIGGGQTSRIGALEGALKLACDEAKDAVLASDGFLPHEDNIYAAAQARVSAIIQPGGSIKDPDVIRLANQYKMAMVTTGVREFRH